MTHLKLHSLDKVAANIDAIAALFPNAVTEALRDGKTERAIDFDVLRQELSDSIVEGREERYQFTWPDKRKAVLAANAPITSTLRPVVADSVGKDGTPGGFDSENLYIEGDNLEVLKLLQETYLGKVKMIYIDPPYNTGNDFVYEDDFAQSAAEYLAGSGQYDEAGNRMVTNTESNGRFHTDWLNMIYPRLKLAKDLLADNGVICISIDDNELAQIKKICDELFGDSNFEGHIHWRRRHNQPNDKTKMIGLVAEHILVYAKNGKQLRISGVGKIDLTGDFSNPDNDPRGAWASKPWKTGSDQSGSRYVIKTPTGKLLEEEWMGEEQTYLELLKDNRIFFPKGGDGMPRKKYFKFEREAEGQCATNWWDCSQFGHNQGANMCMLELFGAKNIFSNPKPVELIRGLIQICNVKSEDIILDFFSGSATTAHAVMQLNAEDGGHRKFILVQLPEKTDEKSEAFKAGYPNICEIGKERIRRAGRKIREEAGEAAVGQDFGFRCLRIDSSNMEEVYYEPEKLGQRDLFSQVDNVKQGRTAEDLLFQVMLDMGIPLSSKISERDIAGKKVFDVGEGFLLACFDSAVTEEVVTEIAKQKPQYAVLRDSSMANDSVATNFEQIFASYSPETERKVL
jgi:type III restriction system methyltransferase